jgi:P27 family predicted phage terminase small subunit
VPDLDPPAGLPAARAAIWQETVAELADAGTLFRLDLNSLAAYVAAVADHRECSRLIAQSGVLIERDGKAVTNPALQAQTQAAGVIAQFAKQFGLTRHKAPDTPAEPPKRARSPLHERDHAGRWCEEHRRWECVSPRSRGRGTCHGIATANGNCRMHAGHSTVAAKAVAKLVRQVPTYGEPVSISPGEALLQEVRRSAGIVAWLGEVIGALDAEDVVWGIERRTDRTAGDFPGADIISSARPNVWVSLYQQERRHLVACCAEALRANVDERLVRLAELQGGRIVTALNGIFEDLELTAGQRERLPEVVPRRLRELVA